MSEKKEPIFILVWTLVLVSVLSNVLVVGFIGTRFFTIKKNASDFTKLSTAMETFIKDLQLNLTDEKNRLLPMLDQKSIIEVSESKGILIKKGIELKGSTSTEKEINALFEQIKTKTEEIEQIRIEVLDWRRKYNVILNDVLEEKTLKSVIRQYNLLNSSVQILAGKERLKQVRVLKKLKKMGALGEESQIRDDLINSVKNPLGTKLRSINKELSQIELNIEKLSSEEQIDRLVDLKDNKIRQGTDRLGKDIAFLEKQGIDLSDLSTSNLHILTSTIFGEGFVVDYDHQSIKLGTGGLYSLQRNRLLLLQSREDLLNVLDDKYAEINQWVANIRNSAEVYLRELTDKQNKSFDSMWKNSLMLSGLFLSIFLILAGTILRNIKRQIQQKKDADLELTKERELAVELKDKALASADALKKNAEELNQSNLQLEEQSRIKIKIDELNDKMRGQLDPEQFGTNVLSFLVEYLDSQLGAIYIADGHDSLRTVSTYAHSKSLSTVIKFGEGLVGQAAKSKKTVIVTDIPENYFKINSSLGETKPRNILLYPILHEQNVKGVLEIASVNEYTQSQINFLNQVNENISINLNGSMARSKMQELVEESQTQSEAMQSQEEELRASNEELEEQTQNLRESQDNLQKQQKGSEGKFKAMIEATVDSIITIDEKGIIQSANSSTEKMFGYSEEEIIGKNVNVLIPSPDKEKDDGYLANYIKTGQKKIIGIGRELVGKRKDGTSIKVHLSVGESKVDGESLFVGIIRDLSKS